MWGLPHMADLHALYDKKGAEFWRRKDLMVLSADVNHKNLFADCPVMYLVS